MGKFYMPMFNAEAKLQTIQYNEQNYVVPYTIFVQSMYPRNSDNNQWEYWVKLTFPNTEQKQFQVRHLKSPTGWFPILYNDCFILPKGTIINNQMGGPYYIEGYVPDYWVEVSEFSNS